MQNQPSSKFGRTTKFPNLAIDGSRRVAPVSAKRLLMEKPRKIIALCEFVCRKFHNSQGNQMLVGWVLRYAISDDDEAVALLDVKRMDEME